MNNIVKRKADLITRYLKGALDSTEQQELENWVEESEENRHLFESLTNPAHLRQALNRYDEKRKKILDKIQASIALNQVQRTSWWFQWRGPLAMAALIAVLIAGAWLFWYKSASSSLAAALPTRFRNEVLPGEDKAKLTLDDGSVIILIDTVNGVLASEANGRTKVYKENGWLSYHSTEAGDSLYYNTIRVPRKGQYKVLLPDGSRVWLNAGSSLRYPVVFGLNERRVELRGEAYFEVTSTPATIPAISGPLLHRKNAVNLPFIVSLFTITGAAQVQVLGTRFNVKAYTDEPHVQTTLLEGSIKLRKGPHELLLQPGQQGRLGNNGQVTILNDVNTGDVIGWKEGLFRFKDANLREIMKQVERWYDVEVVYEMTVQDLFTGSIERNTPLSQLLQYLERRGKVQFAINGNKVIVTR